MLTNLSIELRYDVQPLMLSTIKSPTSNQRALTQNTARKQKAAKSRHRKKSQQRMAENHNNLNNTISHIDNKIENSSDLAKNKEQCIDEQMGETGSSPPHGNL